MPDAVLVPFVEELRAVVTWAQTERVLIRDDEAKDCWAGIYPALSEGETGLLGAMLSRAEAHALRLSMIYAVLDRSPVIRLAHLLAGLAVWEYAEDSTRRIFGRLTGLTVSDTILAALRKRGPMTRTQINALFHRNKSTAEIAAALQILSDKKLARQYRVPPAGEVGRPAERWEATG